MATLITLPKERKDLHMALRSSIESARTALNIRQVTWQLVDYYLDGVRDFSLLDMANGIVQIQHLTRKGKLPFKYEEVLKAYVIEVGQLMRMNVGPHVVRDAALGSGLDALRDASVAQLVMNELMPVCKQDDLKLQSFPPFIRYGAIGLQVVERMDDERERVMPGIEVVPPWEIIPLPVTARALDGLSGMIRYRWETVDWLKEHEAIKKHAFKGALSNLKGHRVPFGTAPSQQVWKGASSDHEATFRQGERMSGIDGGAGKKGNDQEYVRVAETWLWNHKNRCTRWVVSTEEEVLVDVPYEDAKTRPYRPIWFARYHDNGPFYGRGFPEPLLPVNHEVEVMLRDVFANVRELDAFGFTMVPTTWGLSRSSFKSMGKPKVVFYEPDYTAPDMKAQNIGPSNTGTLPGEVAKLGMELIGKLTQHSEMLSGQAPGRIDSARALGLLFEASTIPLTNPTLSLSTALSGCYAAMLDIAKRDWTTFDVNSLSLVDDNIVGVALDPESGEVDLDSTPVPRPERVTITLNSRLPTSKEQKKAELAEHLAAEIITKRQYRIEARKLGLDLPVSNEQEWQNYRQAVLNNIIWFGDGEVPGEVTLDTNVTMSELHLEVLTAFMSRPEFRYASEAVRAKFEKAYEELIGMRGEFPEQLPMPEEMAAEEMGMPPQGGMPGPGGLPGPMGAGGGMGGMGGDIGALMGAGAAPPMGGPGAAGPPGSELVGGDEE